MLRLDHNPPAVRDRVPDSVEEEPLLALEVAQNEHNWSFGANLDRVHDLGKLPLDLLDRFNRNLFHESNLTGEQLLGKLPCP